MSGATPPPAPPAGSEKESWLPRTDAGARKLIDRIDKLTKRMDREFVTHRGMMVWIGAAAVTIVGGAYLLTEKAASSAAREADRATAGLIEAQKDVRALYDFLLKQQPQIRFSTPTPLLPGSPPPPAAVRPEARP